VRSLAGGRFWRCELGLVDEDVRVRPRRREEVAVSDALADAPTSASE
jgi:hypothetical protein